LIPAVHETNFHFV